MERDGIGKLAWRPDMEYLRWKNLLASRPPMRCRSATQPGLSLLFRFGS